jgi:hypothetical protein
MQAVTSRRDAPLLKQTLLGTVCFFTGRTSKPSSLPWRQLTFQRLLQVLQGSSTSYRPPPPLQ